jgi:hypothetical protein
MAITEEKVQLYIVAIVGVVAAVGILVLLMGTDTTSESDTDIIGQATTIPAGMFCCAPVTWSDGTTHCISYSSKPCKRTN